MNLALAWPVLPASWRPGAAASGGPASAPIPSKVVEWRPGAPGVAVLVADVRQDVNDATTLPSLDQRAPGTNVTTTGTTHVRGRYEVTDAGRLLRADVEQETFVEMRFGSDEPQRHHMTATLTALLVDACDGPTLPRPTVAEAPGSRALAVWAEVVESAAAGRPVAMKFHEAVRRAHVPSRIDAAVHAFVERHDASALGHPAIPPKVTVDGATAQFTNIGSARLPSLSPDTRANVKSHVTMDLSGPSPVVRAVRIEDSSGSTIDPRLLIIDAQTLWPPPR